MKKTFLLLLLFGIAIATLNAQDFSHPMEGITKVVIHSDNSIKVIAHDEPNLLIKANENIKMAKNDSGSSFSEGNDNTGFGVAVRKEGSQLLVSSLMMWSDPEITIYLPKTMNIAAESLVNSDITVKGFTSEIEAKNDRGDIFLTNLTGPIVAENLSGDVRIAFSELSQISPTSIVVENGNIYLRMPKATKASITCKVTRGNIYTDFKISSDNQRKSNKRSISGSINKGGVEVFLQSLKGNIYLQKEK